MTFLCRTTTISPFITAPPGLRTEENDHAVSWQAFGLSVPKNLAFLIPEILARLAIGGRAKTLPVPPGR